MSFIQLTKDRYSVRKFSDRPIEPEKLMEILEAGRRAPTAVNFQPQRILVINSKEGLATVQDLTKSLFGAPLALVVCYDKTVSWKSREGREIGDVDASIVTTQMMYAAEELGLGTIWIGGTGMSYPALKEAFLIPDFLSVTAVLGIGYAAEDAKPHPLLHFQRYALEEIVYYSTFDGIEAGKPGRQRSDGGHEC